MNKVFLGGTCNESTWREELIDMLKVDYFNPIVDDWTEECMEEEIKQREIRDYCLYVLTPKMTGYYSVAEAVEDSNKKPEKTLFCVLEQDYQNDDLGLGVEMLSFDEFQMRSWSQIKKMIKKNGGKVFETLNDIADYLNNTN